MEETIAELEDRAGSGVGNGDMIMVLLSQQPEKPWNQIMMRETLKLSEEEFEKAVGKLTKGKWVKLDPTTNSILPSDRAGSGGGNGYWADDQKKYEAALRMVQDRTGGIVGNG